MSRDVVSFHFDPMCPFAYQASRWIREVRALTGLGIDWRFFSLEEINRAEGKKHPWERPWSYGWSLMRIGAALRRRDPALLDQWYAVTGRLLHEQGGKPHEPEVARELLAGLGAGRDFLDQALADPGTQMRSGPIISGWWTRAGSGCPPCSSPAVRACSGRCWWTRRRATRRWRCGT